MEWPTTYDAKYGSRSLPISGLLKLSDRKHRPALVFIHETMDSEAEEELMAKMFGTEEVILGTRFFRCFRMNVCDIPDEKMKEKYASRLPALIFLDGRGEEAGRLGGMVRASRVQGNMRKVFSDHFKANMQKLLKSMSEWLDDIERAEDEMVTARKTLDDTEERMADRDAGTAEKKISKKREDYDAAVAAFEKLRAKAEELFNPPLKQEETASRQ